MRITLFSVIICLSLGISSSLAQGVGSRDFGKNRIQYKNFEWFFYSTDNFDVYYYSGGKELAKTAIDFLEVEFDRITDLLGYAPYAKTKIFIYNSIVDLQQSNIGISDQVFTIGGQTSFVKLQTEVAFTGTMATFKRDLLYNIANMLINDMMFGGSLADMFQSTYLMTLPDWFVQGAARYAAEGWGEEMDDFMRDALASGGIKKLERIEGEHAAIAGQSVWNYIANRYGKSNISNVLNLTRIIRNEENSIASTLGLPFKQFIANWQQFYKDAALRTSGSYVEANPENILVKAKQEVKYNQLKFSPNGSLLAYSENYGGKYIVYVKDINTGVRKKVVTGGYRVINQSVDYEIPLVEWIDDDNLGIIQSIYGKFYLVTYNLSSKTAQRKPLDRFENIKDLTFNENGRLAVISADVNGVNDLYLISMRRNAIRRLTRDQWDDVTPRFLPGADAVVFSSNRTADTLGHPIRKVAEISDNYNLFLLDLDTTKTKYLRLTNTLSKDYKPIPKSTTEIYYLSDQKGISNIYKYSLRDSIFSQVTGFSSSIVNYDIHFATGNMAFTMMQNGMERIFLFKNYDLSKSVFTPQTLRREIEQARALRERIALEPPKPIVEAREEKPDSAAIKQQYNPDEDFIDTDNYQFKDQIAEKTTQRNFSFLSNYRKLEKTTSMLGPLPYDTRFSADNVVTSFVIDPLRGFGMLLETSMNDMLENHKFYGGILAISDLRSGDVFGEYQYLKYRVDFKVRYNRNVILRDIRREGILQKYALNTFSAGASLPFTNALRLDITPHVTTTRYLDFNIASLSNNPPNLNTEGDASFMGINTEVVFDNSIVHGLNIYEGTRAKIGFKQLKGISDNGKSFNNLFLDARHYQRLHRDITFASRLFYGKFFGNNAPKYMLGGLDNWIFNKTNSTVGSGDPLRIATGLDNSNILFHEFVTTLRGFDYNTFNGTDALLFNAELRFPAFRYFMRGPISSNFFRNFQLIGFYDVGSAWTGTSPFSKENDVNTRIIKIPGSPFQAILDNSRSPWLASYGVGLRTVLLGYYLKFDVAKPVQDFIIGPTRLHITLGYDF